MSKNENKINMGLLSIDLNELSIFALDNLIETQVDTLDEGFYIKKRFDGEYQTFLCIFMDNKKCLLGGEIEHDICLQRLVDVRQLEKKNSIGWFFDRFIKKNIRLQAKNNHLTSNETKISFYGERGLFSFKHLRKSKKITLKIYSMWDNNMLTVSHAGYSSDRKIFDVLFKKIKIELQRHNDSSRLKDL